MKEIKELLIYYNFFFLENISVILSMPLLRSAVMLCFRWFLERVGSSVLKVVVAVFDEFKMTNRVSPIFPLFGIKISSVATDIEKRQHWVEVSRFHQIYSEKKNLYIFFFTFETVWERCWVNLKTHYEVFFELHYIEDCFKSFAPQFVYYKKNKIHLKHQGYCFVLHHIV